MQAEVINVSNLDLTFETNDGPVHALKNVNLEINKGDFVLIDSEKKIQLCVMNNCKIFEIISPLKPVYKTYAEVHNVN